MSNVYDSAYSLEKAIRDSDDFKKLKQLYDNVNNDASSKRLFDSFRETQFELQQKQMMGEDISEQDIQMAQQQFALIQQHEGIAQLMQAEERMSMIVSDLTRVIMKPLEELYGAPEGLQ
jgi:cell fate (sporulation/competence/biofilm development) regulator YlbF (YheA/YmcA/DUF963 family)